MSSPSSGWTMATIRSSANAALPSPAGTIFACPDGSRDAPRCASPMLPEPSSTLCRSLMN